VKERRAGAAVALGNLDAHDAELEQLVDQRSRDLRVLVHFANLGTNFAVGEFVHAVAENDLVFGQAR
jgi:hypothetical protein